MAGKKTNKTTPAPEVLELDYQLAELPSSQHRAGLAGLVLMVDWVKRQPNKQGICEITQLNARGTTLKINRQGVADLFDEVYAASLEESSRDAPLKNRQKEIIPYLREEKQSVPDAKTGKAKEKTQYIYEWPVPKGAFLLSNDPSADGHNGPWIKLWRDVIWNIFRGVPTTRKPFEDRAEGRQTDDSSTAWRELSQPLNYTVNLPSTYFVGAQANNAENVPFKDRARFQFLLHFWPYTAQVYVPAVIDNEGERNFVGYALAIPDVANLELFCEELPAVLRGRGKEMSGYRPRDCIVDLAIESALDTLRRLRERLTVQAGDAAISDLVLGIDVVHLEKQGNSVRLLGCTRLDPESEMIDRYSQLRNTLRNPVFRRQQLLNLVNQRQWHWGFDNILCRIPFEQTIGSTTFRHDTRESFQTKETTMGEQINDPSGEVELAEQSSDLSEDTLIYRLVGFYLSRKLKSKYGLEWAAAKNNPSDSEKYQDMKEKLAREAFLAIRSRTGQDFIDYFSSTLCSVPQHMNERSFVGLTKALIEDTDKVRTLTMLALSARS